MNNSIAPRNFLITGLPGCGKSTVIEKTIGRLRLPCIGFFTREIRKKGRRVGFSINTLDGRQGVMAHLDIKSRYRVGRYGVDLQSIDQIAVPSMLAKDPQVVIIIDEIGKMECLSAQFKNRLNKVLDSQNPVLGSIALKGDKYINAIKQRSDTVVISVSRNNRDTLADYLLSMVMSEST